MTVYATRRTIISQFADTDGDGTGTIDATADTSGTADEFYFTASTRAVIARMIVSVGDTTGMQAQEYGNLGAALPNGVTVVTRDDGDVTVQDLTGQDAVTTNANWGEYCYDVDVKTWGSGNELLVARWTFLKTGTDLILEPGWDFVVNVNDDQRGLLSHRFLVQGYYI